MKELIEIEGRWDTLFEKYSGLMKRRLEIAPLSRVSIAFGRIVEGVTTVSSPLFMVSVSATFVAIGFGIASPMKDIQGFSLVMNFLIFHLFEGSEAI